MTTLAMDQIAIISKSDAQARGLLRFFTGKPCSHGHVAERFVSNHNCVTCRAQREQRRRLVDPARDRAIHKRSYKKHREQRLERHKSRNAKIADLLAVLRQEMPDLLREFGL